MIEPRNVRQWEGRRFNEVERPYLTLRQGQGEQGFPGVKEPGMLYNDITATWETQLILSNRGVW